MFNGDFVDRGPKSAEIVFILYAYKLWNPNCIHLNRGNHEARKINEKYNFEEECTKKYDAMLFELFQGITAPPTTPYTASHNASLRCLASESFNNLPLATLINERVLVLHGGLFKKDGVTMREIEGIKHRGQPKSNSKNPELQLMEDILWSDPKPGIVGRHKSSRGAGTWFGPDVTKSFLLKNSLDLLIRSHELVDEGYQFLHENRVLTVFSASNYCGRSNNKGAYAVFKEDLKPRLHTFVADAKQFSSKAMQKETLEKLRLLIFHRRYELAKVFTLSDRASEGAITRYKWAKGMLKALDLRLPWLSLQPLLCDTNPGIALRLI